LGFKVRVRVGVSVPRGHAVGKGMAPIGGTGCRVRSAASTYASVQTCPIGQGEQTWCG